MRRKLLRNLRIGGYHFDGDLNKVFSIGKLKSIKFEFEDCVKIDVKKGKLIEFENRTGEIGFKDNTIYLSMAEIPSEKDLKKIEEIKDKINMLKELAKGVGEQKKGRYEY